MANNPGPCNSMNDGAPGASYRPALALLASLFFMWGFITVINNTLLPHLRSVFELNYFQTTLIESTWFIGYLLASIPAAKLIERIGYQRALDRRPCGDDGRLAADDPRRQACHPTG